MKFFKTYIRICIGGILAVLMLFVNTDVEAQIKKDSVMSLYVKTRPLQRVGNTFESVWIIDNQTTYVPLKRTLEFDILHRFGTVNNGYKDFYGIYAPSNIRLGLNYSFLDNLNLGFGFTKYNLIWDLNAKYALLQEESDKAPPVSLTYFVSATMDSRAKENFVNASDRLGYFHSIMVSRKVTRNFSAQGALNLSHMNAVEGFVNVAGEKEGYMKNDHLSFSLLGRYKLSDATAIIANYDQPITKHLNNNPKPNLSAGIELATPLHAFQVFIGNYQNLIPNYNNFYNQNNFGDVEFLVGFNITRLIDTQEEDMSEMMFKKKEIHY